MLTDVLIEQHEVNVYLLTI